MTHPSFTLAPVQARALAQARTVALVTGYRDWLSFYHLALLLLILDRTAKAQAADSTPADHRDLKPTPDQPLRGPQNLHADAGVERGATAPLGGNPAVVTDNAGRSTLSFYDELNRPIRIVGPAVNDPTYGLIRPVTVNSYDTLGNLVQVSAGRTDSGGLTPANDVVAVQQTFAFDDFGRKLRETDVAGKYWRYRYDDNANLVQATDPRGQLTTLAYGYGGQLLSRTNAAGTVSYTRNPLGQVTLAQSPEVGYAYTYDAAHRRASLTDSRGNKTLTYGWSPGGRLNRMTGTDTGSIDYHYDAAGRLTTLWDSQDSYLAYIYDQGARLRQKWLANGVTAEYAWNPDNTLAQLKNSAYDYDPLGNRLTRTDNGNQRFQARTDFVIAIRVAVLPAPTF